MRKLLDRISSRGRTAAPGGEEPSILNSDLGRTLYQSDGAVEGEAPTRVAIPTSIGEVRAVVAAARESGLSIVPRGAGTGLSGGAVPVGEAVVLSTMKLNEISNVDGDDRTAWVGPGVRNLDLSRHTRPDGLFFGPDPSSQSACTIGGNIATNAGGPRCYAVGSTTAHVLAVEIVLPDATTTTVGGDYADPIGLDTRAVVLGSEGTVGISVRALVRLLPVPEATRTVLCAFTTLEDAGAATAKIVRTGVNAVSIELMNRLAIEVCERFTGGGLPLEAESMLLCEVEGTVDTIDEEVAELERAASSEGAYLVQVAESEEQAEKWWRARKGAFGAVAQLAPNYHLHDGVVPRTRLVEALQTVQEIGRRTGTPMTIIAHAGDGNLHPLISFDERDAEEAARVHAISDEIMDICLDLGGAVSGEHGIGTTKVHLMERVYSEVDLDYQCHIKRAFDPTAMMNPSKVLPSPTSCAEPVVPPDADVWI